MTKNNKIFGWLSMSALLLTASCSDKAGFDTPESGALAEGKTIVNLTVDTQTQTAMTRAGESAEFPLISDGSKADYLIYSVYEKQADGSYKIAKGFGDEASGQKKIQVSQFPVTLQFIIDKEAEYTVAFWAQSSKTDAFDTSDLQKVKVKYENAVNNDELRDAFCATAVIKGVNSGWDNRETVLLRRPLAQINIGTTGWDYEAAAILRPNPRTYSASKVKLSGLAQYYNVLTGLTLTDDELGEGEKATTGEVNFALGDIPAFFNLTEDQWENLSYLPYSKLYGPKENNLPVYDSEIENFLKVQQDDNEAFKPYYGWEAHKTSAKKLEDTETFKYLSMCYVLVPVTKEGDKVKGSTVPSLTFYGSDTDPEHIKEFFTVSNIPVQQNWRTNILSDQIFMASVDFKLFIVPTYCGDYNNLSGNINGDSKDDWDNVDKMEEDSKGYWHVVSPEKPGTPNPDWDGYKDPTTSGESN